MNISFLHGVPFILSRDSQHSLSPYHRTQRITYHLSHEHRVTFCSNFFSPTATRLQNMQTIEECVCLGFMSLLFSCFIVCERSRFSLFAQTHFFILLLCVLFFLLSFLGYWVFGAQFCDTWVAFDVMCSTASILNLCAISLDRYIHIKDPLR